jgi:cytochrome b561
MHWPATLLVLAVLSLAWVATSLSPEAANKGTRFVLHRPVGLTILDIAVCRIVRRMFHETPPHPPMPVISRVAGA